MRKIIASLIFILTTLFFQGCEDFLVPDVRTDIVLTNYGNTPTEASLLLTQAYNELRDDNITGSVFWRRFTTDYEVPPAGTSLAQSNIARMSYDANDGEVFSIWQAHYRAVSRPNLIIEKAVENLAVAGLSPADEAGWKKIEGEARFLRAFLYFNLARLYRNTPIIDQFFETLEAIDQVANLPGDQMKAQEMKVYEFIINDLNIAINQLADASDRGRATKPAAKTLLAHVYLTLGTIEKHRDGSSDGAAHYQNSLQLTSDIINSNRFALKRYFPDNFIRDKQHTGNNEFIWTLEYNELDNAGSRVGNNSGYLDNSSKPSNVELGTLAGANGGKLANDFGFSTFDLDSPGDLVRRFWTFEEGEFRRYDTNGDKAFNTSAADCPNGENCEIFLRTLEPYPWTRPYWFEVVDDANSTRSNPGTADVGTNPDGSTYFTTIWGGGNANSQPGVRLVKFRRNPVTQPNYSVNTYDADLPVYRYAEVLLMYAEAANELSGPTAVPNGGKYSAVAAVNLLRDRARNFVYYPNLTEDSRIIENSIFTTTYKDVFSRVAKVGKNPATTDNAADTLAKYYFQISAFRGLREVPAAPNIRNFREFEATKDYVPDFSETLSMDAFREALLDERYRELAGENNQRWYDLVRYGRLVDRIQEFQNKINPLTGRALQSSPFGQQVLQNPSEKFEYLPIPKSEIDRNTKLNQNPGF